MSYAHNHLICTKKHWFQHNRIYDGRQIRVQLRDNNPQRNPWRLNRMRDRVPHFAPPPRHGGQGEFQGDPSFGPPMRSWGSCIQEQRPRTRLEQDAHPYKPFQPQGDFTKGSIHHVGGNTVTHDSPPTMQNLYGGLRAPSASTSVSVSPPPSVAGSQPAMSTSFSHQPGVGFYAPQPWLHSYPPYPYTFPMVPSYMGYQPSNANATSGQNGNTPPAMVQHGGLPPSGSKVCRIFCPMFR